MLTAKDLLYKAIDYDGFWNSSKRMRDSEPAKARKLQLESLLKAFNILKENAKNASQIPRQISSKKIIIKTIYSTSSNPNHTERLEYIKTLNNLQYFTYGEFLGDVDRLKYKDFLNHIISVSKINSPAQIKNIEINSINLVRLFCSLFNIRKIIYHTLESNYIYQPRNGFSVEEEYPNYLNHLFVNRIPHNLAEIDEALCLLIDPEKKSFNEHEILYPTLNLDAVDLNWKKSLSCSGIARS